MIFTQVLRDRKPGLGLIRQRKSVNRDADTYIRRDAVFETARYESNKTRAYLNIKGAMNKV